MAKYDNGFKYDKKQSNGGLSYDYRTIKILIQLFDGFKTDDNMNNIYCLILKREEMTLEDFANMTCNKNIRDDLKLSEETLNLLVFIEKMETIKAKDVFFEILARIYSYDNGLKMVEELNLLAMNTVSERINFLERTWIDVFVEKADELGLKEAKELLIYLQKFETLGISDIDLDTAVTDFFIGKTDGLDDRFDNYLIPFDLLLAPRQSTITIMPPTESSQISIPYADGSITQDTIYTNRNWELVGYSMQNMSIHEKEALKEKITELLDETKNKTKKLTLSKNQLSFDVKYQGELDIEEAPTWIKASIPLEVSPYGTDLFVQKVRGDGILINKGHADIGVKVTIESGCVNPNFFIGSTEFLWSGVVPKDTKLIIDNENRTCYLEDGLGTKTQALKNLAKGDDFCILKKKSQMVVRCENKSTRDKIYIEYQPKYLWKDVVDEEVIE